MYALQQLEFGYLLGSESRFVEQLMWKLRTAVIQCPAMQTFVPPALLFSYIMLLHAFAPPSPRV